MTAIPKMGDLVRITGRNHNGKLEHMALVTHANANGTLNLVIFPDGCAPYAISNVRWNAKQVAATSDNDLVAYPHEDEVAISVETDKPKTNKAPSKTNDNAKTGVNKAASNKSNSKPVEEEDSDADSEE